MTDRRRDNDGGGGGQCLQRDNSGERVRDLRVSGDDARSQADGRLPHADGDHVVLHHGLRHRDPRQPVRLSRHLPQLSSPYCHELLPRLPRCSGPHDHHFR